MQIALLDILKTVEDQRKFNGKEYKLEHILFFTILAILCEAKTYIKVFRFIRKHFEQLKTIFHLKLRRFPTYSCIWRILVRVKVEDLESAFRKYSTTLSNGTQRMHYCVDAGLFNSQIKSPQMR
jgi:hypothetical protein